jgi:hypothetical protein
VHVLGHVQGPGAAMTTSRRPGTSKEPRRHLLTTELLDGWKPGADRRDLTPTEAWAFAKHLHKRELGPSSRAAYISRGGNIRGFGMRCPTGPTHRKASRRWRRTRRSSLVASSTNRRRQRCCLRCESTLQVWCRGSRHRIDDRTSWVRTLIGSLQYAQERRLRVYRHEHTQHALWQTRRHRRSSLGDRIRLESRTWP